jgi:hypothetical protein
MDGRETREYVDLLGKPVFDGPRTVHFLAVGSQVLKHEVLRVDLTVAEE